jgi:hypothetical protein
MERDSKRYESDWHIARMERDSRPFITPKRVLGGVAAFCVVIVISDRFYDYSTDALIEWLSTLIGTILGASLAATIGVWLFYYQGKKAEEARVEQLREALIAELYATIDRLSTTPSTQIPDATGGEPNVPVVITSIEPTVCEEVIRSALFGHRNTVTLTQLARLMREYTKAADLLSSLLYSPQITGTWFAHRLYVQGKNTKGLQQFVILFCETALKGFEAQGIELPPSERYYSDPNREAPPDFVSYDQ